jgi:hypothetical protein
MLFDMRKHNGPIPDKMGPRVSTGVSMATEKWHYYVRRGDLTQDTLNDIGKEGWELVAVTHEHGDSTFYFKRPHPSLAEAVTIEQRERYFDEWGLETGNLE